MTHLTNAYNLFFNGILSLYFPRVNKFEARLISLGCCELFSDSLSESESYKYYKVNVSILKKIMFIINVAPI